MTKSRILIIDDEKNIRTSLTTVFRLEGYDSDVAETGEIGIEKIEKNPPDLVLLDVKLPGIDGIELLEKIVETWPALPVVMMSGHGTIETAVQATKLGASDFIEKPLSSEKLLLTVAHHLKLDSLVKENLALKEQIEQKYRIIGESPVMKDLLRKIETTAPTNGRALIMGEHGTGKELVARAIHRLSLRSDRPFIKVNCAAIPTELIESELFGHEKGAFTGAIKTRKGKFELSHRGTLFLDEIGDMELQMQAKLLRVLQEGEFEKVGGSAPVQVDVRVIAATNKNLLSEIEAGRFREDLFYRLNVIPFQVPPLRDRTSDLPLLCAYFLAAACTDNNRRKKQIEQGALDVLSRYGWPGNVRELKNIVERLVILVPGDAISEADVLEVLPGRRSSGKPEFPTDLPLKEMVAHAEKEMILQSLDRCGWHIRKASEQLKIERSHLYKKMKQFGISREDHAGSAAPPTDD